jgi:DNA-binding NarL/FixJ family response regulator
MSEIRVAIVDDHPLIRKALEDLLRSEAGISVIGEASNGAKGLELIVSAKPDIAVIDIDMPVLDGIELARLLKKQGSKTLLIFLTILKDRSLIRSMAELGARGYVLKDSAMEEVVECVRAVAAGERWLSPKLNEIAPIDERTSVAPGKLADLGQLTPTELKVLALIAHSRTNREIADELSVSVRTIETHRYNICSKFDLKGSHSLLRFAAAYKRQILTALNLSDAT